MKFKFLLIGIMMALMLCITPVAAVSGDDFEIVTGKDGRLNMYKYCNMNNPDEEYIDIYTIAGTRWLNSLVTFKPANISDAPVMVVDTSNKNAFINLSRSVDDWEIKFYSSPDSFSQPDPKYLKNAGVVNLNKFFEKCISKRLLLELSWGQTISGPYPLYSSLIYTIPDVDRG